MKILVVSHEFPPIGGGGANACYFLTREFVKNGHDVEVITARFKNQSDEEVVEGVYIHRVNCFRKNKEHCDFLEMLSFVMKSIPYSERLHKKYKFDICLIFFAIPSGPVGYVLKKKYKLPYLIRFGGGDVPGFQKRFVLTYKLLGLAIRKIWDGADALIANSTGLRKMALDYYSANDFKVIYNGVDTDYFIPKKKHEGIIKILFVSRLIERKGLQDLIPKFRWIIENTEKKVELVIVGDGPYRKELEMLVEKRQLEKYVRFEGNKNRDDILPYYQQSDIFVFPSRKEGMPNVVLEAMACGLPIVMTPCEGSEELVEGNGYISQISDFHKKVLKLVNDEPTRIKMGLESRRRTCDLFSWKKAAQEYMDIIAEIEMKYLPESALKRD